MYFYSQRPPCTSMLELQMEDIVVEIDHFLHYYLLSNIVNHMCEMDQVNKLNHVNVNDVIYLHEMLDLVKEVLKSYNYINRWQDVTERNAIIDEIVEYLKIVCIVFFRVCSQ